MTAWQLLRWLGVLVLSGCIGLTADAQPVPPRDRRPQQAAGTCRIKGRVVDAQTGSAVARARIGILGPMVSPSPVLTDENGRFEVVNLPAGRFFLNVEKSGYAFGRYPEPGLTIRGGGRPLIVTEHETVAEIVLPMYRAAVITGRVVDAHGDALESVQVQAFRLPARGHGAPMPRQGGSTNDLGEFRIVRLEPGSYVLLASPRNAMDIPSDGQPVPTYFPNTPSLAEAQPIVVERAQTVSGIEIMVAEAATTVVSGTVIDPKGQPVSGFINARRVSGNIPDFSAWGTQVRDGTFKMYLAAGEYELEAREMRPGTRGPVAPGDELIGVLPVSLTGAPMSDLTVQLGTGAVISGRIVFDGQALPPDDPQSLPIGLGSMSPAIACRGGRSEVLPDWTFRIEGAAGMCTIMPAGIGRWTMKSAGREGLDLLDRPVRIAPGQVLPDVQVVFTDRRTDLTLDVTDEHGLPTRDFVAVVFPRDRKRWTENSRYVRLYVPPPLPISSAATGGGPAIRAAPPSRPDSITGLPPGEYYVAAVEDLPSEGNREAALLESLVSGATRVTLADSTPVRIALRRGPTPR
jgi:hypothetical protein